MRTPRSLIQLKIVPKGTPKSIAAIAALLFLSTGPLPSKDKPD
jgi:hypothetical protein